MFNPQVDQEFQIQGKTWRIVQHPGAPGMPYGQEGRAATVYQVTLCEHRYDGPVVLVGPGSLYTVPGDGTPLRVGRGPDNEAVIDAAAVSRQHGALVIKDGQLFVWDNSSRNGTFIDGKKVEPQQWIAVPAGSRLQLGTPEEGAALAVRPSAQLSRALKVFKPRFRAPALVELSAKLAPFAALPGLAVCERAVLTPQGERELLVAQPDLVYAALMPWMEGRTWMEIVAERILFTPDQALQAARSLVGVLQAMEQKGVAHCDLSGPNVTVSTSREDVRVDLVDVEQLFGPGLAQPEDIFAGSPGYAHRNLGKFAWSAESDRFSGAILLCEMLAWCEPALTQVAWSESFFDPAEMQQEGARAQQLRDFLARRWGQPVARLFDRVWSSDSVGQCPTFGEWEVALPSKAPAAGTAVPPPVEIVVPKETAQMASAPVPPAPSPAPVAEVASSSPALTALLDQARRHEDAGNLEAALQTYREVQASAGPSSAAGREAALIIEELERKQSSQRPAQPAAAVSPAVAAAATAAAPAAVATAAPSRTQQAKAEVDPALLAKIRELEGAPGLAPKARPAPPKPPSQAPAYIAAFTLATLFGIFWVNHGPGRKQLPPVLPSATPAPRPTIKMAAPAEAFGTVHLALDVDHAEQIKEVVFEADSKEVGRDSSAPYACEWTAKKPGPAAVVARALLQDGTTLEDKRTITIADPLEVKFYVTVTDPKGRHPIDLKAADFRVLEDGVMQKDLKVARTTGDTSASIVIIIDHSGSMAGMMGQAIAAASSFVGQLKKQDRACVVGFSDRPARLAGFTNDKKQLKKAIGRLTPQGGTSLYDSIDLATDLLSDQPEPRVIILLTDGKDENARGTGPGSVHTLAQTLKGVERSQTVIYALGLGTKADKKVLDQLAATAGGRSQLVSSISGLAPAYTRIAEELRSQYTVRWNTTNPVRDGKWRAVEVRVLRPGCQVSSQPGYEAPRH